MSRNKPLLLPKKQTTFVTYNCLCILIDFVLEYREKDSRKTTLIVATSVFVFLTLLNTSKGLTIATHRGVVDTVNIVGSASPRPSPRRKVARLAIDSDSASASTSRPATIHKPCASRIRILNSDGAC